MSILRLDAVRREIGDFVILDSVSAALARGERAGLVGANGAGKTTLLSIIEGRQEADAGRVHVSRGVSVGLLTQEANLDRDVTGASTVRAAVRGGAVELEHMESRLAALEASGAEAVETPEYAELQHRFEAADGYHLDRRVEETLAGLGIGRSHWDARPTELSGGEQTRVSLARLLLADPDILLLDEPTNHLDVAAIEWLERALAGRATSLLVASHDRVFLDNVVERIWELRDRRLTTFRGGYSAFLVQREAADARLRSEARAGDVAIQHEEALVQRYRSQRKHVKMHEHERRLERLREGRVSARGPDARLHLPGHALDGARSPRSAEVAVALDGVVCGYRAGGDTTEAVPIVRVARLEARAGERIGLVGPNGAGKSTLLRTLAGQLPALDGYVRIGRNVAPGYLSQLRDRPLPGADVLDALTSVAPLTPGQARSYLARFLFRGDDVSKPVTELSGGERSRFELALLCVGATNLLLLDEPTNHLDIPAREALEAFLRDSDSTLIIVSHDRRLLQSTCQRLWVVEPGTRGEPAIVAPFDGGHQEWRAAVADGWTAAWELGRRPGDRDPWRSATSSVTTAAAVKPAAGADERRPDQGSAADDGPRAAPSPLSKDVYRREHRRIEADLERLTERKASLEAGLEDPGVQANFVELRRLGSELADVDQALNQAEDAWLAIEERAPR